MEAYSRSDIGLIRSSNQDACFVKVESANCAWAVVCDGMGGANGGNIASSMTVDYICKTMNSEFSLDLTEEQLEKLLTETVIQANTVVFQKSIDDLDLSGMGTTCELVFVKGSQIKIVHVGDSRTYSIRGGKLKQLTEDHSVVQEMVRRGEITPAQAENHPNKNYITRAIGIREEVVIDYIESDFVYGDIILICTDGLSNMVSGVDLIKIAHENRGEALVEQLVEKAKLGGGKDNITAVVIY